MHWTKQLEIHPLLLLCSPLHISPQTRSVMKHPSKILVTVFLLLLSLAAIAHAGDEMNIPPTSSSPELNRIKGLAGRWVTESDMFGKKERLYVEYEVTAHGNAVLERIFPGTPHEMISVYYDNKGKLTMTHYCIIGNRPTMKLAKSTDDMISLRLAKLSGAKSKSDPAMSHMDIIFTDKNHMTHVCYGREKGKEKPEAMTMEYTRVEVKKSCQKGSSS